MRGDRLLGDGELYLAASRNWLAGQNPWTTELDGVFFAAPPPTLLPLAPLAMLPEPVGLFVLAALIVAGCLATVRMLGLPLWWLLFPPLVHSMLGANVQGLLVPLVLAGGGGLAALLKIYAIVPDVILGRWRPVAFTLLILVVTVPLMPWPTFFSELAAINGRLEEQAGWSLPMPLHLALAPVGLLALLAVGRANAAWLAVPALWPSAQQYYATLVLPTGSAVAAAVVVLPVKGAGLLALVAVATHAVFSRIVTERARRDRPSQAAGSRASSQPSTGPQEP